MKAHSWQRDPSLASYLVATSARSAIRPLSTALPPNQYERAVMDRILRAALVASRPRRGINVKKVETCFAGCRVRGDWIVAPDVDPEGPPVLYIHGGAFSMCCPDTRRGLLGELSAVAGRPMFAVRYRLAPKYPYAAAADDALMSYRWLTGSDDPVSSRPVAVAGDSAGSQLAVGTMLGALAQHLPVPQAMLFMSPVLDLTCRLAEAREARRQDPFASARSASRARKLLVAGAELDDPRLNALDAPLSGAPPTLIRAGRNRDVVGRFPSIRPRNARRRSISGTAGISWSDPRIPGPVPTPTQGVRRLAAKRRIPCRCGGFASAGVC